jgi:hypothetical protein
MLLALYYAIGIVANCERDTPFRANDGAASEEMEVASDWRQGRSRTSTMVLLYFPLSVDAQSLKKNGLPAGDPCSMHA